MSLDNNLFTLWMVASEQSPGDIDCIDPQSSEVLYRKRRRTMVKGPEYFWSLLDPVSDAMLATVTALGATAKTKTITLHDPEIPVQLSFSGTMSFKWNFEWEGHEFEWRKDSCYLVRKPDPPVQVAVTDPAKKGKAASVQVLDYNLRRFDIDDKKGLEVVMLCALLTFTDYTEGFHQATTPPASGSAPVPPVASGGGVFGGMKRVASASASPSSPSPLAPVPPPVPKIQYSSEPNEVIVAEEGSVLDYAQHCANILADKDMLFVIIKSSSPDVVQRVVQVAQETKRLRHRAAEDDDEELHQYLTYDNDKEAEEKRKKQRKIISLDDKPDSSKKEPAYKPLQKLTIHLSKIPLPELMPKTTQSQFSRISPAPASSPSSSRPNSRPTAASSSRPSYPQQPQPQPAKLQKPTAGKHGRSSSAEPRPPTQQRPSNANLAPAPQGSSRPRPVSSHGLQFMPAPNDPNPGASMPSGWSLGSGGPSMPRPTTPGYAPRPPQPQQQPPPPAQQHSSSTGMSMLEKLLNRI